MTTCCRPATEHQVHSAAPANNGLANNYFGVTHDSLPNYIAATSGQTWGSNSDDTAQAPLFDHQNLVDQLEAAHVSWKAYMGNLPFPGDLANETPDGLYVRKHDPFLMYPDVYTQPVPVRQGRPADAAQHRPVGRQGAAVRGSPRTFATTCMAEHPVARSPARRPTPCRPRCIRMATTSCSTWVGPSPTARRGPGIRPSSSPGTKAASKTRPRSGLPTFHPGPDFPILPATPADLTSGSGGDLAGGTVYGGGHVPTIVVARGVGHRVDSVFAGHDSLPQTIEHTSASRCWGTRATWSR